MILVAATQLTSLRSAFAFFDISEGNFRADFVFVGGHGTV
jgi:hypothetical protein